MTILQHYRLIHKVFCALNELKTNELDLLIYLYSLKYFTIYDFRTGQTTMSWDRARHYRLQKQGWIKRIYRGSGHVGGKSKYVVSVKGKLLVARIGRVLQQDENLPEIKNPKGYMQTVLLTQTKKYNKLINYNR